MTRGWRLNDAFMKFATDFAITRVDVSNATGYAYFAQGDLNSYYICDPYVRASGTYNETFADGVTLTNVHARDGDGELMTEA